MSRLRVGVVGAGVMGRRHLAALSHCATAEVVGVVDHHPESSSDVAVFEDIASLLTLTPEAVIVATPASTHRPVAERCLAAGAHVLVEKPLATSSADARAIRDEGRRTGRLVAVGHVERFSAAGASLRRAIREMQATTIATVRTGPRPDRVRDVGALLDLAVHDIDLVRWATGRDYVDVKAGVVDVSQAGHESAAMLAGTLDDGTVVTHEVSWLAEQPARRWTVAARDGAARSFDLLGAGNAPLVAQLEAFVAACVGRAGVTSLATVDDGAAAVEIALAGLRPGALRRAQDRLCHRAHPQSSLEGHAVIGAQREREGLDPAAF